MSISRLDVKSLIALVDEDELRKELNKDTYYWNCIITEAGCPPYSFKFIKFKTEANPIEYLIFNDDEFTSCLLHNIEYLRGLIIQDIKNDYQEYINKEQETCFYINTLNEGPNVNDKCYDNVCEDIVNEHLENHPTSYSELIWKNLKQFTIQKILHNITYGWWDEGVDQLTQLELLDGNLNYILPTHPHRDVIKNTTKLFVDVGFFEDEDE